MRRADGSVVPRIWFICKHDAVNRYLRRILKSDARCADGLRSAAADAVTLDPLAHAPMRVYAVQHDQLRRLLSPDWKPLLALAADQREIVNHTASGALLILGRSGTGKTVCIAASMQRDRAQLGPRHRQVFVATSSRLCAYVKDLVGGGGGRQFLTLAQLYTEVERAAGGQGRRWPQEGRVDYARFRDELLPQLGARLRGDPSEMTIWVHIRSFLRGSAQAALGGQLSADDFARNQHFNRRTRLEEADRRRVGELADAYAEVLAERGLWDDASRACALLRRLREHGWLDGQAPFDAVYIDEVQDMIQADLLVGFEACGRNPAGLRLAGDPAQAIQEGVAFQFSDIRDALHRATKGRVSVEKPLQLSRNYRSDGGILDIASAVLERLEAGFPGCIGSLRPDGGLARSKNAAILLRCDRAALKALVEKDRQAVLLVRDSGAAASASREFSNLALSVSAAKGLEFKSLVILDFVGNSPEAATKAWPVALGVGGGGAISAWMPSMEVELKRLYCAITRARHKLVFVETDDSSRAVVAMRRWLTGTNNFARVTSDLGHSRALTPAEARNRGALLAASATCPDAGDEAHELLLAARRCFDLGGDHIRADAVAGELLALKLRTGSSEEAGVRLVTKLLRLGAIEAAIREAKRYGAAGHLVALELAAKFLPGEKGDTAVLELRGYRVKDAVAVANYALTTAAAAGLGARSCLADLRLRIRSEMTFSIASRAVAAPPGLDATGGAATTALRAAAAVRRLAACDDALAAAAGAWAAAKDARHVRDVARLALAACAEAGPWGADDVPVVEALAEAADALGRTPLEDVSRWMDFVGGDRVASLELANVEQCAICMEDLHSDVVCSLNGESDATVSRLPCGHFVHTACQDAWAATGATTCSVCRTDAGAAIGVRGIRPAEDDTNSSFVARGRELGRECGTAPRPKTLYSTVRDFGRAALSAGAGGGLAAKVASFTSPRRALEPLADQRV